MAVAEFGSELCLLTAGGALSRLRPGGGAGSLPAPKTVAEVLGGLGWVAGIAVLPLLLLLFPDGRPPSRRWRFLTWTVVATGTVLIIIGPLLPGRSGFVAGQKPLGAGGVIGEVVTILVVEPFRSGVLRRSALQ